jgi:hypothetical protein
MKVRFHIMYIDAIHTVSATGCGAERFGDFNRTPPGHPLQGENKNLATNSSLNICLINRFQGPGSNLEVYSQIRRIITENGHNNSTYCMVRKK